MAADLRLSAQLVAIVDSLRHQVGTDLIPVSVTGSAVGGACDDFEAAVGAGATVTLWDATTSPVATFTFLALYLQPTAAGPLLVELQGTTIADNSHVTLVPGVPFFLGSNGTTAYNAASFGGALQSIARVRAKNNGATGVSVRVLGIQ